MGYVVVRDGKRRERPLGGSRKLAEILSSDEYQRVEAGSLVAFTEGGGLMSLDAPLTDGQVVILRPLRPEADLAGFGFPVNRKAEVVGISELLAIRKYEERHGDVLYELPLEEIRRRVSYDASRGGPATTEAPLRPPLQVTSSPDAAEAIPPCEIASSCLLKKLVQPPRALWVYEDAAA